MSRTEEECLGQDATINSYGQETLHTFTFLVWTELYGEGGKET